MSYFIQELYFPHHVQGEEEEGEVYEVLNIRSLKQVGTRMGVVSAIYWALCRPPPT